MKLKRLQIRNFLGARGIDVSPAHPIVLFAGYNYAGKTSIKEAVRMALTGESARGVDHKKDYDQLLTNGAKSGFVEISIDDANVAMVLPKGDRKVDGVLPDLPLSYILDAQRLARLEPDQRRSFLFGLMRVATDGASVQKRMLARGCNPDKTALVIPMLRGGFDAAYKEATNRSREAKGAWRAITGETYGERKAGGWRADKPDHNADLLAKTRADLADVERNIEDGSCAIGELRARAQRHAEDMRRLEPLREIAKRYARVQEKLRHDEAELAEWEKKVAETRAKAAGKPSAAHPVPCPHCAGLIEIEAASGARGQSQGWVLRQYQEDAQQPDLEAVAQLPEHENALSLFRRSVENDKRDLDEADRAANTVREIEESMTAAPPGADEIAAIEQNLATLRSDKAKHADAVRLLEGIERAAAEADQKTAQAMAHHQEVAAWDAISDALSPSGIRQEILAEALAPINARLDQSAVDTGWAQVRISGNMDILSGPHMRPYALLSESERWRADAMIAEAISYISGAKILMLDGFDVLDLNGRNELFGWLHVLAKEGEVGTALVFGTLKQVPQGLDETIEGHWIDGGIVEPIREAA